jgi:hypothetical protein
MCHCHASSKKFKEPYMSTKTIFTIPFCFQILFFHIGGAQIADTAKVDSFSVALKRFTLEITTIRAESDSSLKQYDKRLKELEQSLASATSAQRLKILEERIRILEARDTLNAQLKRKTLGNRYSLALQALDKMIQGVTHVKSLSELVGIEQGINLNTSPWSDSDFRDGWDKLKDYASLIGLLGTGVALKADATPQVSLAVGLGAMFIPQGLRLLGVGTDKADTIRQKVEFIDFTRNAYNELQSRSREIQQIYIQDSTFLESLKLLRNQFSDTPSADSLISIRIYAIQVALQDYNGIEAQIPKYLQRTLESLLKYKDHPQLASKYTTTEAKIKGFLINYERDYSILTKIPLETRKELFSPN